MTTTNSKFAVTYEIDYIHRVIVGVTAPDAEAAIKLASYAFDEGKIWNDTEEMPLLFDDFEEVEGETLVYSAQEVSWFPEPDASVVAIKQKEFAFNACQALLAGQVETALSFAMKAMPNVAAALSSEQDDKESTWQVTSDNGCDPFEVTASSLNDARRDALHAIGWDVLPKKVNSLVFQTEDSCLTSTEVIELAKDHDLKLSLFSAGIRFIHNLLSDHNGQYFHEAMDGIVHQIIPEDFLDTYPDSLGKIWTVHQKTDLCLTSKVVLEIARDNDLKLHLILPGGHPATHYLGGFHRNYYYLESMDGAIQKVSSDDFLDTYPDSLGKVWLIIEKTSTVAEIQVLDIFSMVIDRSSEKMAVVE